MNIYENEENFRCPLCFQQILDSEIHEHIQHCNFYSSELSEAFSLHLGSEAYSDSDYLDRGEPDEYSYGNSSQFTESNLSGSENSEEEDSSHGVEVDNKMLMSQESGPDHFLAVSQSIASCPVCFNNYRYSTNVPLLLPNCGHTVCANCLKRIKEHNARTICPICRKASHDDLKSLPVNYVLLELTQETQAEKCKKHGLETIAFCCDDDSLLCGACVLEHKTHNCLLLTDPALEEVSKGKKEKIEKGLIEMLNSQKIWRQNAEELQKITEGIEKYVQEHQIGIREMEKILVERIGEGKEYCTFKVESIGRGNSMIDRIQMYHQKINKAEEEIKNMKNKINGFEKLGITEKLLIKNTGLEFVPEETSEIFEEFRLALDLLEQRIDYKESILSLSL